MIVVDLIEKDRVCFPGIEQDRDNWIRLAGQAGDKGVLLVRIFLENGLGDGLPGGIGGMQWRQSEERTKAEEKESLPRTRSAESKCGRRRKECHAGVLWPRNFVK
jgi:hypothetical protein